MAESGCTKLLVRHLPSHLNVSDKTDLLKHFGAKEVICMERRGKMRDAAFAEFSTQAEAAGALSQLHQIEILGSRLTVEYAKPYHEHLAARQCSRVSPQTELAENGRDEKETRKQESEQGSKEKAKSNPQGMAPGLGINYAPNPSLHYVYPPVNATILTNIAHTLACVPRFYIQVLHLMNKMNLPAPFGQVTPTPPVLGQTTEETQITAPSSDDDRFMSSDESEIESDEEEREKRAKERAEHAQRMAVAKPVTSSKKRHKVALHPSQPPTKKGRSVPSSKHVPVEKAFEQPSGQSKKIEFKLTEAISSIFDAGASNEMEASVPNPPETTEGFGRFAPAVDADDNKEDKEEDEELISEESNEFISSSELRRNRISSKEMADISAFKNYKPGDPTCRLYIKNLAKHVEEKDLKYIFGRYVNHSVEEERDRFDVRLMKEGRMKGQAFITLPSEEKAKRALRDAHGYILHGKPMVIQFARSAKAKD